MTLYDTMTTYEEAKFMHLVANYDPDWKTHNKSNRTPPTDSFEKVISEYLNVSEMQSWTILGIDIYRYSQYPSLPQALVPLWFYRIYSGALSFLEDECPIFDKKINGDLREHFISTGDGGFQILPTPLHAIKLLCILQLMIDRYNGGRLYPHLHSTLNNISLRYCIAQGPVFRVNHTHYHNFYGPAIIDCARILSKDKLNRVLIDDKTYEWFMKSIAGVENLSLETWDRLAGLPDLHQYNLQKLDPLILQKSILCEMSEKSNPNPDRIIDCNCMKLSSVKAKENTFNIYNLYLKLQVNEIIRLNVEKPLIVAVGNLNVAGIE